MKPIAERMQMDFYSAVDRKFENFISLALCGKVLSLPHFCVNFQRTPGKILKICLTKTICTGVMKQEQAGLWLAYSLQNPAEASKHAAYPLC